MCCGCSHGAPGTQRAAGGSWEPGQALANPAGLSAARIPLGFLAGICSAQALTDSGSIDTATTARGRCPGGVPGPPQPWARWVSSHTRGTAGPVLTQEQSERQDIHGQPRALPGGHKNDATARAQLPRPLPAPAQPHTAGSRGSAAPTPTPGCTHGAPRCSPPKPDPTRAAPVPVTVSRSSTAVPRGSQGHLGMGASSARAGWARTSLQLAGVPLLNLGSSCLLCFLLSRYRLFPTSQVLDQSLAPALPKHSFPVPAREPARGRGPGGRQGPSPAGRPRSAPAPAPLEAAPTRREMPHGAACPRGVPEPREPPGAGGTWVLLRRAGPEARARCPRAGCAEMNPGERGDGKAAGGSPGPPPRARFLFKCAAR